jgi:hypothetical protein
MHTDGRGWAGIRQARSQQNTRPGKASRADTMAPAPSTCIGVHLRLDFLACVATRRTQPQSSPIAARQPRPHAPIQATVPSAPVCVVAATPHAPIPRGSGRACPRNAWQNPMQQFKPSPRPPGIPLWQQNPMHQFRPSPRPPGFPPWQQNPMHQFRGGSRPILPAQGVAKPHATIQPTIPSAWFASRPQNPMHQFRPPPRPAPCHRGETLVLAAGSGPGMTR